MSRRAITGPLRRFWVCCAVIGLLAGCRTPTQLPPIDISQPGWRIQHGQAVWQPNAKGPELSGELLWASHPDGRFLLQFLKTPITLVEAQGNEDEWRVSFPPQRRSFSGSRERSPPQRAGWLHWNIDSGGEFRGRASSQRLGWLHLVAALQARPMAPEWKFAQRSNRSWQLMNARTGEMIEGYLAQ